MCGSRTVRSCLTNRRSRANPPPCKSRLEKSLSRGRWCVAAKRPEWLRPLAPRTFFGKTAELVRTAHAANRQEHEIVHFVRDLFVLNAGLVVVVLGFAHVQGMTLGHTLPLVLTFCWHPFPSALAGHVHAGRGAWVGRTLEVRRAGDAAQRLARHRLDDGAVQRQNRHPYAQ